MKAGHSVKDKATVSIELLVLMQLVTNIPSPKVERSTLGSYHVGYSQR